MRAQASCEYTLHFLDEDGTVIGAHEDTLSQTTPEVVDTSDLPFAEKAQGSITLTNVCEYGSIAGKATTIEPAKGLSYDTALVPRIAP